MSTTRTEQRADWVELLEQAAQRNDTVAIARPGGNRAWRLRLLTIDDDDTLVVEHPPIAGEGSALRPQEPIEVRLLQGQARWAFNCTLVERFKYALREGHAIPAARLSWPTKAERMQRRAHYRAPTIGPERPELRAWLLNDVASAVEAEEALELAWRNRHTRKGEPHLPRPSVGRELDVEPVDLSGGGICVTMPVDMQELLQRNPILWIEFTLAGDPLPVHAAAKIAHWHQDQGALRVGLAFTFEHHPAYASFVADRLMPIVVALQREEIKRHRA